MADETLFFADMGIGWMAAAIESLPTELRFGAILAIIFAGYKIFERKYPKTESGYSSLEGKISTLELHVTNHLTTEIHDVREVIKTQTAAITAMTTALQEQTKAARDVEEEATRTNRSVNVVLSKLDELDKSIDTVDKSVIRLEGRIRQSP